MILSRFSELKDARDASDGATPLHWAAQDGRSENIDCLLRHSANLFAVDSSGETRPFPTHTAFLSYTAISPSLRIDEWTFDDCSIARDCGWPKAGGNRQR